MNKLTLEYEDKGKQYVFITNFQTCSIKTNTDTIEVKGGINNTKLCRFSIGKNLTLELTGISDMTLTNLVEKTRPKINYTISEKPKKKKRKKKNKKAKAGDLINENTPF